MRTAKSRVFVIGAVTAAVLAVAGCSSTGTSSSSSSGTVAVSVGNGLTVHLTKKPLRVAVFVPGTANQYGISQAAQAKTTAAKLGMKMTLFDAGYDPAKQLAQMQTALQSGKFDAALVQPSDGGVICKITTQQFPKANILVSNFSTTLCDEGEKQVASKGPSELWAPGTLNFVGSNNYIGWIDSWFTAAAKANPGTQHVAVVLGPATAAQTRVVTVAENKFKKANPKYTVDTLYGDYSTPTAFNQTQSYLQGHPNTSLILSIYTPDVSQGIIKAIDAAGMDGKINVVDQGFGTYSLDQIKSGGVQLSSLFFPANQTKLALESLANAQKGKANPRFIDDSVIGTASKPYVVTKSNIDSLPASVR
jgi:ribose transport system substrate-binding protein